MSNQQSKLFLLNALLITIFGFSYLEAEGRTVMSAHSNLNIRSGAGKNGHRVVGQLQRFEEVQILSTKKIKNGETWYRVVAVSYRNGKKISKSGWINASYTAELGQVEARESTEAAISEVPCANCDSNQNKQIADFKAISDNISGDFVWPTRGEVRSGFGNRLHPIKNVVKLHRGIDISGNAGAEVMAAKSGTVVVSAGGCGNRSRSCNGGAGNMITIEHGDGTQTRYLHLSPGCALPPQGSRVEQGSTIACVGATGAVTGPHLHFEVKKNVKWIDPLNLLPNRS